MASYHSNYLDYFRGDITLHTLKQVVASEGGRETHLDLFLYLINPTFKSLLNRDMRCLTSILFQYPIHTRLYLAWILYREELRLQDEHQIKGAILLPIQTLLMHSRVLGEELSPIYIEAATHYPTQLHTILGFNEPTLIGDLAYDLTNALQAFNHPDPDINLMYSFLEGGNRLNTGVYIAQALGYQKGSVLSIQDALNRLYV
jgi:hypothetical protein